MIGKEITFKRYYIGQALEHYTAYRDYIQATVRDKVMVDRTEHYVVETSRGKVFVVHPKDILRLSNA